jgi:porphobilinogen deaminase
MVETIRIGTRGSELALRQGAAEILAEVKK